MMHGQYSLKVWSKHPRLSGASMIVDWSHRAFDVSFTYGEHGFERANASVTVPAQDAMLWRDKLIGTCLVLARRGRVVWEGRIEDATITIQGGRATVTVAAFGYWRAFDDAVIKDLWSDMRYESWTPLPTSILSGRKPEYYDIDFDGRLYMALRKDQWYHLFSVGTLWFRAPQGRYRKLQTLAFTLDLNIPANWQCRIESYDDGFVNGNLLATHTGPTTISATPYSYSSINRDLVFVELRDTRAGTTLSAPVAAGVNVAIMVASNASLTVGDRVMIGGTLAEPTTVLSKTSTNQFNATINNAHATGDSVTFVNLAETGKYFAKFTDVRVKTSTSSAVYADEVVREITTQVNALNSGQISNVTGRVPPVGTIDLKQYEYDQQAPSAVLDGLRDLVGSSQRYRIRVADQQMVTLEPRNNGDVIRSLYVRGVPQLTASLDQLTTRVKPLYTDSSGLASVGTTVQNTATEALYGIARQQAIQYPTTTSSEAASWAAIDLADRDDIKGYGEVTTDRIFAGRTPWPLDEARPGYLLIMIDLPSEGGTTDVYNRAFRIGEATINLARMDARPTATYMPENMQPTTETLLARLDVKQPVYEDKTKEPS